MKRDIEEARKSSTLKIEQFNQEIKDMKEKTTQFLHENEKMMLSVPKVTEADLDRANKEMCEKLKEILMGMVNGVNEMLSGGLEQEKNYSGWLVVEAMRTALQRVAEQHVLGGDEEEED
jgi:hypothetical protein